MPKRLIQGSASELVANGAVHAAAGETETALLVQCISQARFRADGPLMVAPLHAVASALVVAPKGENPLGYPASDFLRFATNGVVTTVRSWQRAPNRATFWTSSPSLRSANGAGKIDQFEIGVRPNPGFVYNYADSVEYLVTISTEIDESLQATKGLLELAEFVANAAASEVDDSLGSPILFMQGPVAGFRQGRLNSIGDGSRERPRSPSSLALRVAIGFSRDHPLSRVEFERKLTRFAIERGYIVNVGDRRPGKVRGDWFDVTAESDTVPIPANSKTTVNCVRPICIVGPARVGSTASVLRILSALKTGLVGISVSAFHDIAVIHLVLPATERRPGNGSTAFDLNPLLADIGSTTEFPENAAADAGSSISSALIALARDSSAELDAFSVAAAEALDLSTCNDYLLVAGRKRCRIGDVQPVSAYSVWVYWEVEATKLSPEELIDACQTALGECVGAINGSTPVARIDADCDYVRVTSGTNGRARGRAKFAVPHFGGHLNLPAHALLSKVCRSAELRAREILRSGRDKDAGTVSVDLRIVWRERWLGRTNPLF